MLAPEDTAPLPVFGLPLIACDHSCLPCSRNDFTGQERMDLATSLGDVREAENWTLPARMILSLRLVRRGRQTLDEHSVDPNLGLN